MITFIIYLIMTMVAFTLQKENWFPETSYSEVGVPVRVVLALLWPPIALFLLGELIWRKFFYKGPTT